MDRDSLEFLLSAMPDGRSVFYDFPDRYAVVLLRQALGDKEVPISAVKNSRFSSLLEKPPVKEIISRLGRNWIASSDLEYAGPANQQAFRLSLGTWPKLSRRPSPRNDQITRWGWSLVLQLNMTASHRRALAQNVSDWEMMVRYSDHPVDRNGELTIAWSRIDLDLDTNEALIEEIQSDWVRDAEWRARIYGDKFEDRWKTYYDSVLGPESKRWPESMLTATLVFLLEDIGVKTVFYHTHESGNRLKKIDWGVPPRSIYQDLPRRFCFEITHNGPVFIGDSARKELKQLFTDPDTRWWVQDLN